MTPKVSVIIPVYNDRDYISKCIDTVINQTYKNIEIICVNDCSTDDSLDILNSFAARDSRIIIIDKKINEGPMLARKSGIEAATGEYIIFVDSDDYIDLELCQFINDITAKEDADIIHFSSGVYSDVSDVKIESMTDDLKPLEKVLTDDDILNNAFVERTFATQLWGKIFKADLCKKVCLLLPDEDCYVGEDVFTTFFLTYFAKKYIGIKTPQYYFYRFGLGVSGNSIIELSRFEMFAKMSVWVKYTQEYLNNADANDIQIKACDAMKDRLFADCCEIYRLRLKENDKIAAEDLIYKYWNDVDICNDEWVKQTGKTKEYIHNQYNISEYYISASAYKNNTPKVSFAVYVNNDAENLQNKLNLSLNQSLNDIEYIIVNDGSEDDRLKIIENYAAIDNRITVINQKHRGYSAAANKVLSVAKGKYIYFADAIELLKENFIEEAYNIADTNNADIISFDGHYSDKCISGEELLTESVAKNIDLSDLSTKLIKNNFVRQSKITFNENIKRGSKIFLPLLISYTNNVFCCSDKQLFRNTDDRYSFTAEDFTDYFIIYTTLSAQNIVSEFSYKTKKAISEICKKYYKISDEIYFNLSAQQARRVNEILPEEYKPVFFNTRELRNLKLSAAYRLADKIIKIPYKILNRK